MLVNRTKIRQTSQRRERRPAFGRTANVFPHPGGAVGLHFANPTYKKGCPMRNPDIRTVAEELNSRSDKYEIGKLQGIRKTMKNFQRRPGKTIFSKQTIFNDEEYAFSLGFPTFQDRSLFPSRIDRRSQSWSLAPAVTGGDTLPGGVRCSPRVRRVTRQAPNRRYGNHQHARGAALGDLLSGGFPRTDARPSDR